MTKNQMLALKPGDKVRTLCDIGIPGFSDNPIPAGAIVEVIEHMRKWQPLKAQDQPCVRASTTWFFHDEIELVRE